ATTPVDAPCAASLPAGAADPRPLARCEAARIMTGAVIPEGVDAVVPFEDCECPGGGMQVRFTSPATPGAHIRRAGADLAAGALALAAGRELAAHAVPL